MKYVKTFNKDFIKKISTKLLIIYKNNPLLSYLILFFMVIMLLNNILISMVKFSPPENCTYMIFPEFENREDKYKFQNKIFRKLKKLDYDFNIHTVQRGENYWGIAKSNHINIDTIVGLNPYLKNLYAGIDEKLIVSNEIGSIYIVKKNENIFFIAKLFNLSVKTIEKANNRNILKKLFAPLKEGNILFIPKARPILLTDKMKKMYDFRTVLQSPLGGAYTSSFGTRMHPVLKKRKFHYGLDIRARVGQPISAANSGVVVAAGWVNGYGKYVKIKHYNGYATSYGHLSRIFVRRGQKVKQGQIVGKAGNTGRSTGPHLDFRVWYKGKPQDPAKYLW